MPPHVDDETTLAHRLITGIDSLIEGKVPASSMRLYSAQDHTTPSYTRDASCWANDIVEKLTAIPAALAPPVGIAPPVIAADGTASFYRSEPGMWEANPGVTPTFQWQFSEESATWTDIAGANDSNYFGMSSGFYYRLVEIATNSQGSASQESVSLYYQFE